MKWNVYRHNINSRKIEAYNIFDHYSFCEEVQKHLSECTNKEEFSEKLRRSLGYYFGYKAEWEIVLTSWTPHIKMEELDRLNTEREKHIKDWNKEPYSLYVEPDVWKKIDIYEQVMNNWEIFLDYVWKEKNNECIR